MAQLISSIMTNDSENTVIIPIRTIVSNRKIGSLPTFMQLVRKMEGSAIIKGDTVVVTAPDANTIKNYVEGKI